eukprot:TRINITY_DN4302_c0_g2_i1.p1 TRINITY_DN4302_c0_g2~~TRINITY_DN4302_c0_g2_i1.p1  ORF type:complete len:248 (-),score=-24.94 TRINITY_DN4302_c0_g2_i1:208-951(-)
MLCFILQEKSQINLKWIFISFICKQVNFNQRKQQFFIQFNLIVFYQLVVLCTTKRKNPSKWQYCSSKLLLIQQFRQIASIVLQFNQFKVNKLYDNLNVDIFIDNYQFQVFYLMHVTILKKLIYKCNFQKHEKYQYMNEQLEKKVTPIYQIYLLCKYTTDKFILPPPQLFPNEIQFIVLKIKSQVQKIYHPFPQMFPSCKLFYKSSNQICSCTNCNQTILWRDQFFGQKQTEYNFRQLKCVSCQHLKH